MQLCEPFHRPGLDEDNAACDGLRPVNHTGNIQGARAGDCDALRHHKGGICDVQGNHGLDLPQETFAQLDQGEDDGNANHRSSTTAD